MKSFIAIIAMAFLSNALHSDDLLDPYMSSTEYALFIKQVSDSLNKEAWKWELILVDDGSDDGSDYDTVIIPSIITAITKPSLLLPASLPPSPSR